MARPSKLDRETQQRICDAIAAGNYMETAALYAGVCKDTLYQWLKRGRSGKKGDKRYAEFARVVDEALARSEVRDVALIAKAAEQHWQAAAWRLERRYPARWGRRDQVRHEHDTPDGQPFPVRLDLSALSDQELAALKALVAKAKPS